MKIDTLINLFQDCHLNFLIGSGLSAPYLDTVGNVETLLTDLSQTTSLDNQSREIIQCSILGGFFEAVIENNSHIVDPASSDPKMLQVLDNYADFLEMINRILQRRKNPILSKQINLYTTNVDLFLERALERAQVEFNDGFIGRLNPVFSLNNFRKSSIRRSSHYDNVSEVPNFNVVKLHGSLSWRLQDNQIVYFNPATIQAVKKEWKTASPKAIKFNGANNFSHFEEGVKNVQWDSSFGKFLTAYKQFAIVNPSKEKFQETLLNVNHYELLRMFANQLEKLNSLLIVMGFSMSDEHIRGIVTRAASSNPTLLVLVYAYNEPSAVQIKANLCAEGTSSPNENIRVVAPAKGTVFDFQALNSQVFSKLLRRADAR